MIEFACPGCTKSHEANRAFAGFDVRCLRCGTLMCVPTRSGGVPTVLAGGKVPRPPASRPAAPRPPAPRAARDGSADDLSLDSAPLPPPARPSFQTEPLAPAAPPAPPTPAVAEAVSPPVGKSAAKRRRKQKQLAGVGSIVLIVISGVLALAFPKNSKKRTEPSSSPPVQREQPKEEPAPPAPKPPTPKSPVSLEVAPMPRVARPPVEYERTAAALSTEYAEDPAACDHLYAGKGVFLRGVFHQYRLGTITLSSSPGRTGPALSATLALPTEVAPGAPLLTDPGLVPGQPVAVRGTYTAGCKLVDCTVEQTDAPADRLYLGKSVCLEGAIVRAVNPPTGSVPVPAVVLDPPITNAEVMVTCYFKLSDRDQLDRLKPGDRINVRGRCSGRSYTAVRLDNCSLVAAEDTTSGCVHVPAGAFFLEYEADLLTGPRWDPRDASVEPLPVTAEGLAGAFQADIRAANATYRHKSVRLTGTVLRRQTDARTLILETGTDCRYQVAVVFSAAGFAAVPDDREVVVRGTCSGVWNGSFVRIDSGEASPVDPTAPRTHLDFLPYRTGAECTYEFVQRARPRDNPIARLTVRFSGDDLLEIRQVRVGTFPGVTLFAEVPPAPRWSGDSGQKTLLDTRRYRVRDGVVEIGLIHKPEPGAKKEPQLYWEPVLKAGLKAGQSWSARPPDGRLATYTVAGFSKDAAGRELVEVRRVLRTPTDATRWEEASIVYARGVGEIKRVATSRTDKGEAFVVSEMKLVGDGSPMTELKSEPKK